jgi:hypothetical protein
MAGTISLAGVIALGGFVAIVELRCTGGTGSSTLATLLSIDGTQRLDLMATNWNRNCRLLAHHIMRIIDVM